ncbi:hypothetical protein KJ359_004236 [Pestalotiopsis sp. 9143b]|nr:hypothetical protein KJ359_004236 [Pestalotiopsis sp. 9143b]
MLELEDYIANVRACETQTWGFAIYRTSYGAATDTAWQSLLEAIHTRVREEVLALRVLWGDPPRFSDEETQKCEEFLSLFQLDVKEDQSALEGASADRVREIIKKTEPRPTYDKPLGGTLTTLQGVFLYIDDEVLETVRQTPSSTYPPWIKMVELVYDPDHHKGNVRVPRNYFGWMKMSVESLYDLRQRLEGQDLWKIAPLNTDEALLTIWDGGSNDRI